MRWINRRLRRPAAIALALVPFVIVIGAYVIASDIRLAENPSDRLMPAPEQIINTFVTLATEPDRRTNRIPLWSDTWASLQRLLAGIAIAAAAGLVFGLIIGLIPYARAGLAPFAAAISLVPPLALLPILFIVFGLGETAKIVLIVVGIGPFLIRDLSQRVLEIPSELIVKAQTLGASTWHIALRVALPQVLPRLIQAVRLSLGPAWLFLIAAEAIAAEAGLGYRIFLVRRYLAMDIILSYVIWITFLAFLLDYALKSLSRVAFGWFHSGEDL